MNNLEKIHALVVAAGYSVVYGYPVDPQPETVVSLLIGDSDKSVYAMGDNIKSSYFTVNVTVFASNYLAGYNALLAIKNQILSVAKETVNIIFLNFGESKYDTDLHKQVLISKYKIIE